MNYESRMMIKCLSRADGRSLKGTAILRLDFNTEDEWRMETAIPTIKFILKTAEKVVILSHRGRPAGIDKSLSLAGDARALGKMLKRKIVFIRHFNFKKIKSEIDKAPKKSVILLENVRFLKGEEKNDIKLAKRLASLGDFYVNDAFAVSHRKDASIAAIAGFLPSYAGLELEKEIKSLSRIVERPKKPLVMVLGGGKAHDKLGIIKFFKNKVKCFLLGGVAANTILFLKGIDVGKSRIDRDKKDLLKLKKILKLRSLVLPVDWKSDRGAILDIGPKTIRQFENRIKTAKTIFWSGPMGFIEKGSYAEGTRRIARAIAGNKKAFKLAGGGETVMFLKKRKLDKKFDFISTGGGAMLEFLEGKKLPGIEALEN